MVRLPGTNRAIPNTDDNFEKLVTMKSFKDIHANQMLSIVDIVNGNLNNKTLMFTGNMLKTDIL